MKFLLVAKQEKNAEAFIDALRCLVERGHHVTVAVQERDEARDRRLAEQIGSTRFRVIPCPSARIDEWSRVAPLVRRLRDCVHYLGPAFRQSAVLQTRIFHKLRQELGLDVEGAALAAGARLVPEAQIGRLEALLRLAESAIPTSILFDEFLESQQPDVLLVSPLVHFGSAQADVAASGRRLGIPVWMLLFSWDNLSTKGRMHVEPDLMFVWNEQQRREAQELHGFPSHRVIVVGAPRFDAFFRLEPLMTRAQFHEPLGLDPSMPTLLYLCSSRLIAPHELGFVRQWVGALRASRSDALRRCNIVIRPHPDLGLLPEDAPLVRHRWPAAPALTAYIGRPFDDEGAVVVRTSYKDPDGLYESLVHSTAVVGLNTTAELEAGIVGRPVFTLLPAGSSGDQHMTVHFHYLTREHGGFVSVAPTLDEHLAQLEGALTSGVDPAPIRAFVESFLRPHGIDRPVAPLLADALETGSALRTTPPEPARVHVRPSSAAAAGVLPLGYRGARILVRVTPDLARHAAAGVVPIDRSTVDWLEEWVGIGDVLYDVNAGFGAYTLIAAMRRGATVVAFEPGYKAYGALCENLALNECQSSVIAVPLPLADRDALADMKYERGRPGYGRYVVQRGPWRVRPPQTAQPHVQSVCITRLDTVVERYGLPPVSHLRLSPRAPVAKILKGATATFSSPSLRTIWIHLAPHREEGWTERLEALGLGVVIRLVGKRSIRLVFAREPGQRAPAGARRASSHTRA